MKKSILLFTSSFYSLVSYSQNVGIGTAAPTRAKLEVHGVAGTGSTSAIFGGDGTGISLQRNWPTIGFNQYRDNGAGQGRYMSNGYAAIQYFDPNTGTMVFNGFQNGTNGNLTDDGAVSLTLNSAGNVAVGNYPNQPSAKLYVETGGNLSKGLLVSGDYDYGKTTGSVPNLGTGSRLMFYPAKAAFRAGFMPGPGWDDGFVGHGSAAIGNGPRAGGEFSTAIGNSANAGGNYSVAIGSSVVASGHQALAMGTLTTASGSNSTALGNYVTTNNQHGSFVIGDYSTSNLVGPAAANMFLARFAGGFVLYTSSSYNAGAVLAAGQNAWGTVSDVHRKENFAVVNGEEFLAKIAAMKLVSWNYIGQNPKIFRHYGPMAQEFYAAFGKDTYGNIGNDTTINGADFNGVNLIAIQALEKRTTGLQKENDALKEQNRQLEARLERLEKLVGK